MNVAARSLASRAVAARGPSLETIGMTKTFGRLAALP